jgi:serine protease inhibitor
LKSGTITPLTRLVLTNAIYMKAPWATPFEKSATRPEAFAVGAGDRVRDQAQLRIGNNDKGSDGHG